METLILDLYHQLGNTNFIVLSLVVAAVLCFWCIPETTDLMVNSTAGLAGLYFGRDQRTLAINASTNNPELFSMIVAFMLGRVGGIANPLGSNFANIYLMFIIAPLLVIARWALAGQWHKVRRMVALLSRERRLLLWHIAMSLTMFVFASFAYWCITGVIQFDELPAEPILRPRYLLLEGGIACLIGIVTFLTFEKRLKAQRGELFDDINDEHHHPSWRGLFLGTAGLTFSCYLLNSFFLVWSEVYAASLSDIFGAAVFAGLHYFLGSLVTSLPEMTVAIENYQRLTVADLNTAMASASQSNMTNLAIAALGSLLLSLSLFLGFNYQI
ncbi:MAG: hypothetical protein HC910_14190 [Spirulinaceae cyanobacterium SM2_1_0]|nr:hypothetical protein [Spirulinaceae cyanobacterium SM2_1_0]